MLISENPIAIGPRGISNLICLGCHSTISEDNFERCPGCKWPMCSSTCCDDIKSFHQKEECKVLSKDTKNIGVPTKLGETPRYDIILVLRCVLLYYTNYKSWKLLNSMESHWVKRKEQADPYHMATVRYLSEVCKMEVDVDVIHHVRGVIISNCYEVKNKDGVSLRGVYPLMGRLNHSCVPNVSMISDDQGKMSILASVNLESDEQLFTTYVETTEPTWERINYTRTVHYFSCKCKRCDDPTEIGTYYSCPKCPHCSEMLEFRLLNNNEEIWICKNCNYNKSNEEEQLKYTKWLSCFENWNNSNVSYDEIEFILQKIKSEFHENHVLWVKAAQAALNVLVKDNSERSLHLRNHIWEVVTKLINVFEPGASRRRGKYKNI